MVRPAGPMSDIRAADGRPVTYTCSALPTAFHVGVAAAARFASGRTASRQALIAIRKMRARGSTVGCVVSIVLHLRDPSGVEYPTPATANRPRIGTNPLPQP